MYEFGLSLKETCPSEHNYPKVSVNQPDSEKILLFTRF